MRKPVAYETRIGAYVHPDCFREFAAQNKLTDLTGRTLLVPAVERIHESGYTLRGKRCAHCGIGFEAEAVERAKVLNKLIK